MSINIFIFKRHTVHPSSGGDNQSRKSSVTGICEAWSTPNSTPNTKKRNVSYKESEKEFEEETEERIRSTPRQKNATLFRNNSREYFAFKPMIKDDKKEKDIEEMVIQEAFEEKPPKVVKKVQLMDLPRTPDSDPSSSTQEKKSYFIRLPSFCDPSQAIDFQSRSYMTWLLLVTACYSYNAWSIALRATFPYQTPNNLPIWMAIDYFCDGIYLLDVMFVKPRMMFLNEGMLVEDTVETSKHYQKKLQYKFDILSLLPLDILYVYFGPEKVILRVPRLLKLQTFWEFHRAMDRVLHCPYVVRVGKSLFYIFYLIHLNACAYYFISDYIGLGSDGWVYDNKGSPYIRCFYFATKTATSIGKNPKPEKPIEYLFMTFAWLMGVFVFALLISQIRDIIATATKVRTEYRKSVDACTWYLRKLNLPMTLQRRIACWFSFTWNQQRCFDESKILNLLPYNMKRDVALHVHMSILSQVQLFRDCSSSLLRDLVLQLRPVSYLPGDVVVRRGDVGHHMYIVKSGECFVMSSDEREVLVVLRTGSVFGEISLLGLEGLRRRTATVRSRGYSTLFALSRGDLEAALEHHEEAAQVLRRRADEIIRENAARQALKTNNLIGGDIMTMEEVDDESGGPAIAEHQKAYTVPISSADPELPRFIIDEE